MSQATDSVDDAITPAPNLRKLDAQVVLWCVVASVLLLAAGYWRSIQAGRFEDDRSYVADCPFPLKTVPHELGDWKIVEGSEVILDPLTVRITGSTDHILWTYGDELTGVKLSVLLLYGPAEPVLPHTPQVCYPATGFLPVGETVDKRIKIGDHELAAFRSSLFAKSGGRTMNRTAVYHSFLLNGEWSPSIALRKLPRKSPGIFKVQVQRSVTDSERRDGDEPIENFLQQFLPALETKIAAAAKAEAPTVARQ